MVADVTPPVLKSFNFSPTVLDLADGAKSVTVSASATDNLSGVDYIQMRFSSPTNVWHYGTFRPDSSGNYASQSVVIPEYSASGIYPVNYMTVRDKAGNWKNYSESELKSLGFQYQILVGQPQVINGSDADDTLRGWVSTDEVHAGAGRDLIIGDFGNDVIDGGLGVDTAIWSNPRRVHTISLVGNGDDTITGPEGADTLRGVENFSFTDGRFVTDTADVAAQVYRLYGATLGRAPDPGGLKGWAGEIESGRLTLRQATDGFTSSAEFQNKYGNVDNAGFVDLLYENVLGRDPDSEGFQYWLNAMSNGMNRSEVVLNFSESAENIQRTQASVEQGLWLRDDQAAMVARLYDSTLDRLPDADGLTYWTNDMKAGTSLQQVASGFIGSTEFQTRYGALDDTAFVQQLYRNVLDREGEPSGVETWKSALQGGMSRADVVLGFSESLEHQNKLAPYIDDGVWLL